MHRVAETVFELAGDDLRPGRVYSAAQRRQYADAPGAELVTEALDNNGAIGRHRARRFALTRNVAYQVGGGVGIEVVACTQRRRGGGAVLSRQKFVDLTGERADRTAEFDGAARAITTPK